MPVNGRPGSAAGRQPRDTISAWGLFRRRDGAAVVAGMLPDGTLWRTSGVVGIDRERGLLETRNSLYRLGEPDGRVASWALRSVIGPRAAEWSSVAPPTMKAWDGWAEPPMTGAAAAKVLRIAAAALGVPDDGLPEVAPVLVWLDCEEMVYRVLRGKRLRQETDGSVPPRLVPGEMVPAVGRLGRSGFIPSRDAGWLRWMSADWPTERHLVSRRPKLFTTLPDSDPAQAARVHVPAILASLDGMRGLPFQLKVASELGAEADHIVIHFTDPSHSTMILDAVDRSGVFRADRLALGRSDFGFDDMQAGLSDTQVVARRVADSLFHSGDGRPAPALAKAVASRSVRLAHAVLRDAMRTAFVRRCQEVEAYLGVLAVSPQPIGFRAAGEEFRQDRGGGMLP
jgi:hypothetical protein